MVTVKIKENSKQAKAIVEMLKAFPFVEIIETSHENSISETPNSIRKDIRALSKKINQAGTKKAFAKMGLDYDRCSRQ